MEISKNETVKALRSFIEGNRNNETNWCDWNIPLHWGGCSDPFQPIEKEYKSSLECLKVFAETQYPFIVSTKGRIIVEPEYLDLIKKCNCVIQISAVCSEYDKLEEGAPPFEGRLEMIKKLSEHKRTIVRIQPYMAEVHNSIMRSIKRFADQTVGRTAAEKRAACGTDTRYQDTAYCHQRKCRAFGGDGFVCGKPGVYGCYFGECGQHGAVFGAYAATAVWT